MDGDSNLMDANFVEAKFMASERVAKFMASERDANFMALERDANCMASEKFPALQFHSFQTSANTKSPTKYPAINGKRLEVVSVSGLLQWTNPVAI